MRVLIVYESMFGNTHAIADRIAAGFRSEDDVRVVPVREATADQVDWADAAHRRRANPRPRSEQAGHAQQRAESGRQARVAPDLGSIC